MKKYLKNGKKNERPLIRLKNNIKKLIFISIRKII